MRRMEGFLIIVGLLALCALAPFAGADSRRYDERDRRGSLPTRR